MTKYGDIYLQDEVAAREADLENQQSWSSWAWSYVPQILPTEEELQEEERSPKKKRPPAVLAVGMYAHKASLTFKVQGILILISMLWYDACMLMCSFRIDARVILKDFKKYLNLSDKDYSEGYFLI